MHALWVDYFIGQFNFFFFAILSMFAAYVQNYEAMPSLKFKSLSTVFYLLIDVNIIFKLLLCEVPTGV
jgi:hypothetical protein